MEDLNACAVLGLAPRLEAFVRGEGLAFLAQQVEVSESSLVIGEANVVSSSTKGLDWRRAPKVRMDFVSKLLGPLPLTLLGNRLTRGLCIDARLTVDALA